MMDVIKTFLLTYQLPAIFFGAFFFGETAILSAAFLAGQGTWSLADVFGLSFAGTLVSDAVWYRLGRSAYRATLEKRSRERHIAFLAKLERWTGRKPFLALLFIKFLYGTRILTILYLSTRNIGFWTFTLYNAIGTAVWLVVVVGIGWLAGRGLVNVMPYLTRTEYALLALVVVVIAIKLATLWIGRTITRR